MKVINDSAETNGHHFAGHIGKTYNDMVKILGNPRKGRSVKSDFEWMVKLESGEIATIYNVNAGRKNKGLPPARMVISWHIGARSAAVGKEVIAQLEK